MSKPKTHKLTPWFPPNIKPVHVGVYEIRLAIGSSGWYALWNGRMWGCYQYSVGQAKRVPRYLDAVQNKTWRGLARKPK